MNKMTEGEVITALRNTMYSGAVYMWGANGEKITPELIEKIQDRFASNEHTAEYYDDKLLTSRGKIALDDVGMLNMLSGQNWTINDYLTEATKVIPATDISMNKVWTLVDVTQDGTPKVGMYLGNGNVIVVSQGCDALAETSVDLTKWDSAFIPPFISGDYENLSIVSNVIYQYQTWLNTLVGAYHYNTIPIIGEYCARTKNTSSAIAKQIYGKLVGTHFDNTAEITIDEIKNEIGHGLKAGYSVQDYSDLVYIISVRLYALDCFPGFTTYWGTTYVDFETGMFGLRLSAMQKALKQYILRCRYLDSTRIDLTLLRELFY